MHSRLPNSAAAFDTDGYRLVPQVVTPSEVDDILLALADFRTSNEPGSANARGLLESCSAVARLAASPTVRGLVEPVQGAGAMVVRGLLFDKVAEANWQVGWHQDLMIPVAARIEMPGFGPWSVKQGVPHVRPPAEVLMRMLTLRLHLDDCPAENGPLEVVPGTHSLGIVPEQDVRGVVERHPPVVCTAAAGDVLVMRPLLLHASRRAQTTGHRRVVHLEFAGGSLPGELEWYRPIA